MSTNHAHEREMFGYCEVRDEDVVLRAHSYRLADLFYVFVHVQPVHRYLSRRRLYESCGRRMNQ